MIFVTLGSQKFQFDRLLKAIDDQIAEGKITDRVFAQTGASDYHPKGYEYKQFLNRDEYTEWIDKADIVISHGGTGTIIGAVKDGKKVIAVPRLKIYGEHVDDHQIQLIGQFRELNLICECLDCNNLWKVIRYVKKTEFNSYESNTAQIIENIDRYIGEL